MATYDHLPLQRIEGELDRRKRPGRGPGPREPGVHGPKLHAEIQDVVTRYKARPKIADIDPALILKVTTTGLVSDEEWAKLGLTVLGIEPNKTLILFADDAELDEFKKRLSAYSGEKPEGQKGAPYAGLIDAVESVSELEADDRIGPVLRSEGVDTPTGLPDGMDIFDLELWPVEGLTAELFVHRVRKTLEDNGGEVVSEYRGKSALLVRVRGNGAGIRALLDLPEVAQVDRPPEPDWPELDAGKLSMDALSEIVPANEEATIVGIVDSGLTAAHPLLSGSVIASFGEPKELGDDDAKGHGTPVSGVAMFGDLRERLADKPIQPKFRVVSAKVVNARGKFDDAELVPAQMEKAIKRFHDEFGCRVINISLCDVPCPL